MPIEVSEAAKGAGITAAAIASAGWFWRRLVGAFDSKATRAELQAVAGKIDVIGTKLDNALERFSEQGERIARLEGERSS